jgi:hypothetical protein
MENRRSLLASIGIGAAYLAAARASASDAIFPHLNDDSPKATVVKGDPTVLDFGDGLKIPCDKSAFLTLWEGKTYWLTLGAGRSTYPQRAQGEAVLYALGAMKLLLMTLAFAPERLMCESGGWRLRVQNVNNYVLGDIRLPGKPYWPINDSQFLGVGAMGTGDSVSEPAGSHSVQSMMTGGAGTGPTQGNGPMAPGAGSAFPSEFNKVNAFTSYIVLKKDASLDYVRTYAQVLAQ